jgi:Phosphate-selective porin O and P
MANRVKRSTVFGALMIAAALLVAVPAGAQVVMKVNDNVSFRFGIQMQAWADELQDATTRGYGQNLFIRRARFLVTGQVAPNVTFFFQTDNPNVGKAPKTGTSLSSGFILQDLWAEWKISDALMLSGGEFLVPLSRQGLTSTISFLTLDISPTSTVFSAPTQSNGLRDTGFQAKGYVADGRLEYRAALFQGIRVAGARNAFRRSAYLQYDFFEKERGYVYPGTALGKRKIVALSAGYDGQSKYKSYSGSVFATIPVLGGNEVAGILQHNGYNGGTFIPTIPDQKDELLELGYYVAPLKLQPFVKFESQKFGAASTPSKDLTRFGAGLNYYVSGQNLKFTGQALRVKPKNNAIHTTSEFTIQMQMWYY